MNKLLNIPMIIFLVAFITLIVVLIVITNKKQKKYVCEGAGDRRKCRRASFNHFCVPPDYRITRMILISLYFHFFFFRVHALPSCEIQYQF